MQSLRMSKNLLGPLGLALGGITLLQGSIFYGNLNS